MYVQGGTRIEEVCYDSAHIERVLEAIRSNFEGYFTEFIDSTGGAGVSYAKLAALQSGMGLDARITRNDRPGVRAGKYRKIIAGAIEDFERDRESYLALLDEENLEEDGDNVAAFKSKTLKYECPVIKLALFSQAKELEKYKRDFSVADPQKLYDTVWNLREFACRYAEEIYDPAAYDQIASWQALGMEPMDSEDCTAYGVIGGGIKSHLVYKLYPGLFPNRSRAAIWALWYLSGKGAFGCEMDSEFLMIDVAKTTTQQNYNYPYALFAYYAYELYRLLKARAAELETDIPEEYRYVAVDAFLSFVADQHAEEIALFRSQPQEGGAGYA